MTHLVTPKLGELIGVGGTLLMETPLFLLQATPPSYFTDFLTFFSMIFLLLICLLFPVDRGAAISVPRKGDRACSYSWTAMFNPKL